MFSIICTHLSKEDVYRIVKERTPSPFGPGRPVVPLCPWAPCRKTSQSCQCVFSHNNSWKLPVYTYLFTFRASFPHSSPLASISLERHTSHINKTKICFYLFHQHTAEKIWIVMQNMSDSGSFIYLKDLPWRLQHPEDLVRHQHL